MGGATELGMAQWLPAYAETSLGFSEWVGGVGLALFSLAMAAGRMVVGALSARVNPFSLLAWCCAGSICLFLVGSFCPAPGVAFNQPVVARGEAKRLLELSVAEAGRAFVDAGLTTAEDLGRTLTDMRRLAADRSVLAVMPRMAQVWARKPHRD